MGSQITTANSINSILNQSDSIGASSRVVNAIQSAASKTGVDFSYLMQKASQESSFDPHAKATTSSATGLFQFTSQTWLHMIKDYGDQYGLGNYASQISEDSDGHLSVDRAATRQAILALRKDPQISAEMAGELDKENAAYLQQKVGGKIGGTELYLAHFLGASGAAHFIRQMRSNSKVAAADVLPSAASANPSVFYNKSGQARSIGQIYAHFAQKFDRTGATQMASFSTKFPAGSLSGVTFDKSTVTSNIASLLPTNTAATSSSLASELSAMRSKSNDLSLASTGSTLFNAMVYGQVQNTGLGMTTPTSALNQEAGGKHHNAYAIAASLV